MNLVIIKESDHPLIMVQDDAGNAELKTFAGLSFPSGCYCVVTEGEVCSVPVRALPGKTPHGVTTNVAAELIVPRRITFSGYRRKAGQFLICLNLDFLDFLIS